MSPWMIRAAERQLPAVDRTTAPEVESFGLEPAAYLALSDEDARQVREQWIDRLSLIQNEAQ